MEKEIFKLQRPLDDPSQPFLCYNQRRDQQGLIDPTPELLALIGTAQKCYAYGVMALGPTTGRHLASISLNTHQTGAQEERKTEFVLIGLAPEQPW